MAPKQDNNTKMDNTNPSSTFGNGGKHQIQNHNFNALLDNVCPNLLTVLFPT